MKNILLEYFVCLLFLRLLSCKRTTTYNQRISGVKKKIVKNKKGPPFLGEFCDFKSFYFIKQKDIYCPSNCGKSCMRIHSVFSKKIIHFEN